MKVKVLTSVGTAEQTAAFLDTIGNLLFQISKKVSLKHHLLEAQ